MFSLFSPPFLFSPIPNSRIYTAVLEGENYGNTHLILAKPRIHFVTCFVVTISRQCKMLGGDFLPVTGKNVTGTALLADVT